MSFNRVSRPKAEDKKIHYKNDFELCYIRHKYLRRIKYNPSENKMRPFQRIALDMSNRTFFRNKELFHMIGFEADDVISIANIHIVNFLGLFSLEKMPEKYKEFTKLFTKIQDKKPNKRDYLDKDQANFVLFLKQRMMDLVRICKQKASNIKGLKVGEFAYFYSNNKPPRNLKWLLKDHEKYGFRKLAPAVFKTIKKKAGLIDSNVFDFENCYYVAVPVREKSLSIDDFSGSSTDPYDNMHNKSPEAVFFDLEDVSIWEKRKEIFDNQPLNDRKILIKQFIENNRKNKEFKNEIKTAKKVLKRLNKIKESHGI